MPNNQHLIYYGYIYVFETDTTCVRFRELFDEVKWSFSPLACLKDSGIVTSAFVFMRKF